jgi:hypothetical protein
MAYPNIDYKITGSPYAIRLNQYGYQYIEDEKLVVKYFKGENRTIVKNESTDSPA